MRREVWEDQATGSVTMALFNGDEVIALYYAGNADDDFYGEIREKVAELKKNDRAYENWFACYHKGNVEKASTVDNIEKYDEGGEPIDLKEHPWTLQELYEWATDYSVLLNPYYVVTNCHGDEVTSLPFFTLEEAVGKARELHRYFPTMSIEVRQYEADIEDDDWDGCMDHETFEWEEPVRLDGHKVRIVFDNGGIADITGVITLVDEDRIHITKIED